MTEVIVGSDGEMKVTRVYEHTQAGEQRVLVDRLWPRGIARADERVGIWLPEVGPSTELRQWFHQDRDRFAQFSQRYTAELDALGGAGPIERLRALAANPDCVLATASRDVAHSHVPVLVEFLGSEPVPVVSAEHPIDMLERWEDFGGTWRIDRRSEHNVRINLLRCDGGETVDSLESSDAKLMRWLDRRTAG